MATQVTVSLPDSLYQQADRLARMTGRAVEAVLVESLQLSLQPPGIPLGDIAPVSSLHDTDLLVLTQLQMDSESDRRLSSLLDRQQSGILLDAERSELMQLMRLYEDGLLRKAEGLREAVRRKLIPPLSA